MNETAGPKLVLETYDMEFQIATEALDDAEKQLANAKSHLANVRQSASRYVRDAISAGLTTGVPLLDTMLDLYGYDPGVITTSRHIDRAFQIAGTEFVARHIYPKRHTDMPDIPNGRGNTEGYIVGILSGKPLEVKLAEARYGNRFRQVEKIVLPLSAAVIIGFPGNFCNGYSCDRLVLTPRTYLDVDQLLTGILASHGAWLNRGFTTEECGVALGKDTIEAMLKIVASHATYDSLFKQLRK